MCKRLRSYPSFLGPVGCQMFLRPGTMTDSYHQFAISNADAKARAYLGVAACRVRGALAGNTVEYNEGDYARVLHAGAGFGEELHLHVKRALIPCRRVSQTHGEVRDIQNSRTPAGWPMSRQR